MIGIFRPRPTAFVHDWFTLSGGRKVADSKVENKNNVWISTRLDNKELLSTIAWIGNGVDATLKRKWLAACCKERKHGTARHSASNRPCPAT
jgi:hypothetical protein